MSIRKFVRDEFEAFDGVRAAVGALWLSVLVSRVADEEVKKLTGPTSSPGPSPVAPRRTE